MSQLEIEALYRQAHVRALHEDKRTAELSFSSDEPYRRWFGEEILDHDRGSIRLERLENGAPLLADHDSKDVIGKVENVRISNGRGSATVRFGKSARATEVWEDVKDGIRESVSIGYFVHEMQLETQRDDGVDVYRIIDWEPYEISLVSVPADTSVGIGRSQEPKTICEVREMSQATKPSRSQRRKATRQASDYQETAEEIRYLAETAGIEDIGEQYIRDQRSLDDFDVVYNAVVDKENSAARLADRRPRSPMKREDPALGLTQSEVGRFSISRAILAKLDPDNEARHAGFELECSRAVEQAATSNLQGNIHIPAEVLLAQRDLSVGVAADGGNLVATNLLAGSFIDLLRNESAIVLAGATHIPGLVGDVAIPKQTGSETTFWLAEGGTPTKSSLTIGQVTLSPKTVGAYTEMSRRILKQSTPFAENLVLQSLAATLAQAIDTAAINGSGASNQPLGILGTSGIGDVAMGANGAAIDWDSIVELEADVSIANADVGSLGYLTNASVRGALKKARIETGQTDMCWDRRTPGTPLNGHRALVSNTVPSNLVKGTSGAVASALIFGNWADLLIGMWGSLDLQVNPYSLDTSGAVRITSFQDVDIAVRHAESFSAIQDALTA